VNTHTAFLKFTVTIAVQALAAACSPSQNVDLAGGTTLYPNRSVTLKAPKPLRVVGSTNQLCLKISPPNSLNNGPDNWEWGVRRSDGVLVKVGAVMLRGDSTRDTISSVGYTMSPNENCLTIGPSIYDSLHPPFVAVRITATDSLSVSSITWRSFTGW